MNAVQDDINEQSIHHEYNISSTPRFLHRVRVEKGARFQPARIWTRECPASRLWYSLWRRPACVANIYRISYCASSQRSV